MVIPLPAHIQHTGPLSSGQFVVHPFAVVTFLRQRPPRRLNLLLPQHIPDVPRTHLQLQLNPQVIRRNGKSSIDMPAQLVVALILHTSARRRSLLADTSEAREYTVVR